ncbi:hypothetical protein P3G55_23245 [Leptospira sp. 96542]|nr:hypothetical protein [Leptospira sp. 96542]
MEAISLFEREELSFVSLIDTVEKAGAAIEAIPHEMGVELRSILSRLPIEQGYEEEDCVSNSAHELAKLKTWLSRVPDSSL